MHCSPRLKLSMKTLSGISGTKILKTATKRRWKKLPRRWLMKFCTRNLNSTFSICSGKNFTPTPMNAVYRFSAIFRYLLRLTARTFGRIKNSSNSTKTAELKRLREFRRIISRLPVNFGEIPCTIGRLWRRIITAGGNFALSRFTSWLTLRALTISEVLRLIGRLTATRKMRLTVTGLKVPASLSLTLWKRISATRRLWRKI